ncbi:GNAT family N-acetyltransferase [Chitinophaga sp. Cy-1792]|uniref:GNAT family N-acetyltransferase n=1 Tax=Chitinophaga sp. Cy-1792 TaxID=2608339 RepID=UPI0014224E74|nr:GNAT family N-acetyltransferase [Chitinophaga sp. Cy-1792]NIG53125.1 GNAT family N-acetyltransferase [Chitinophaga sp. Cy-1792]
MIALHQSKTATDEIRNLYESAFPLEERRPWPDQLKLLAADKIRLLTLEKDGKFAGFVFYWQLPAFAFIEYFAISPESRGGGAGTTVMTLLEKELKSIVLEVEPPNTEQAIRRINFYERLHYKTFPEYYEQPPYYPGYPFLQLKLMYLGTPPDLDFITIKKALYATVYNL